MHPQRLLPVAAVLLSFATPAAAASPIDPLRFFEGRTDNVGTARMLFHKPYRTRSIGVGRIERDGSLTLLQRVEDEGKPPRQRTWRGPPGWGGGRFGSKTDAGGAGGDEKKGERQSLPLQMK